MVRFCYPHARQTSKNNGEPGSNERGRQPGEEKMAKLETQIIQTEYGVYVPKYYSPATEGVIVTGPSILDRAVAALKIAIGKINHQQTRTVVTRNAKPAK